VVAIFLCFANARLFISFVIDLSFLVGAQYSVAAQVWKLSSVDQCEIARNSVLQSGLEYRFKRHFLGRHFQLKGAQGNDIRQTNVPSIRLEYRLDQLLEEMAMIRDAVNAAANKQGTRK